MNTPHAEMIELLDEALAKLDAALTIANKSASVSKLDYDAVSDALVGVHRARREIVQFAPDDVKAGMDWRNRVRAIADGMAPADGGK